ncbi:recombinase zinc ribbon domain-containing protein [Sinorhizobium meliloti]|uniref:zinc ribbon domain-containing protein n=1 Tax=Rhizobium meliloti TaxID=382 RepID=UPI00398A0F79
MRARDIDDWPACIPDAHPGYISWERHQENLKILKANGHGFEAARASIPREGPALLQGRAVCGQCGSHHRVRYAARRGRQEAWYSCTRSRIYRGEPMCQSIAGRPVDQAIGMLQSVKSSLRHTVPKPDAPRRESPCRLQSTFTLMQRQHAACS